jgi:hypothetical protein
MRYHAANNPFLLLVDEGGMSLTAPGELLTSADPSE